MKNVSFSYETHHVLDHISLEINQGDFLAILGSNGTGKTTLLKILLNELKPTSGNVTIFGEDIKDLKDWTKISYLSQNATANVASFPTTVKELVASSLHAELGWIKLLTKSHKERIRSALALVGMEDYQNRLFAKLSGGQMQKVLLARSLISNPKILVLDEPTSALDENSSQALFALLKKISIDKKTTIIISTHSKACSNNNCNHIVNLDTERLKEEK
ncbi:MAG: metal ABC transporter ATP-binding protein [Bacilli bacterium]|nr:metal ABC transporter ATP-binding protein [Bacilli bacterium]